MPSRIAVDELLRIIDLCRVVGARGVDPFQVDIESSVQTLKRHLPDWKLLDELLLDSEAINNLSTIVRLQGEWLRHRASSLYVDPVLVELKTRLAPAEELTSVLAASLHPIVHLSQLSAERLKDALDYWNNLLPLSERQIDLATPSSLRSEALSLKDLVSLKVLAEKEFQAYLEELLKEAEERTKNGNRIDYWEFVRAESFPQTVVRAYITSFLVSEGHLALEVDPIEEKTWLVPREGDRGAKRGEPRSVATHLSYEEWAKVS